MLNALHAANSFHTKHCLRQIRAIIWQNVWSKLIGHVYFKVESGFCCGHIGAANQMLPKFFNVLCNSVAACFLYHIFVCIFGIVWWYEIFFTMSYEHAEYYGVVIIALKVIPNACNFKKLCFCKKCLCVFILNTFEFEKVIICIIELPYNLTIILTCEEL